MRVVYVTDQAITQASASGHKPRKIGPSSVAGCVRLFSMDETTVRSVDPNGNITEQDAATHDGGDEACRLFGIAADGKGQSTGRINYYSDRSNVGMQSFDAMTDD